MKDKAKQKKEQEKPVTTSAYNLPDPKEFSDRLLKEAFWKMVWEEIKVFLILALIAVPVSIIVGWSIKRLGIKESIVETIFLAVSAVTFVILVYCFYRYVKARREDDEEDR